MRGNARYWDATADLYQRETRISTRDFHYGPLLPGDGELGLLPDPLPGLRCLEVGCGAGQNSIFLASRGAVCTALDVSEGMLRHGRNLAEQAGVEIDFREVNMDRLTGEDLGGMGPGGFDLVHSIYALPFASDPAGVVKACAELLAPGGCLLFATGHPVYAGEWAETEDEAGLFLQSYFDPADDLRSPGEGHEGAVARTCPISEVTDWIRDAGLGLDRFLEPRPLPIPIMTEEEICARVPYESDEWRALYEVLAAIPIVAVFRCLKSPRKGPGLSCEAGRKG